MADSVDTAGLILEDQLLDHLGTEEGALELRKQRFSVDWINQKEVDVRRVFEYVMGFLREHGESPSVEVLVYEFGADFKEPEAPLDWLIEEFRQRYRRKEAQDVLKRVNRMVGPSPTEAVRLGSQEFSRIQKETLERKTETDSDDLEDVIERYKDRIMKRSDTPTFGYPELDADFNGIEGLVFTIARPKRYKTWQLIKAAVYNQMCGFTVALPSLEMPKEEILDRYACMRAGISWQRFRKGGLTPEDFDAIRQAKDENEQSPNKVHIFRPPVGQRTVEHMMMHANEVGANVCLIDQLKWIESSRPNSERWREVEYICEDLKEAANNYMPLMVAAQFNREAASLSEMADLSKIGLSDAIGQTADLLLGTYASKEMLQNKIIQYGTIDSRNFEPQRYDVKVDLSQNSDFRVLKRLEEW